MSAISTININSTPYEIKDASARSSINTLDEVKAPKLSPYFSGTPTTITPDTSSNDTQIANTAWVKARISEALSGADALVFKGTIGKAGATITTKTLPNDTAKTGWTYKAVDAGDYTVGTGTGTGTTTVKCEIGDMIIALSNGSASTYATWVVVQANIDGAVTGPSSSTTNHIATFNDNSGKVIKDSGFTIATSVPENALFTDQSVTAVGNHYTPVGTTTKSASGASGTSGTTVQVITAITMDAKGHVTSITSGAATDTTYTAGDGLSLTGTTFSHGHLGHSASLDPSITASNNLRLDYGSYDEYGHLDRVGHTIVKGYYTEVTGGTVSQPSFTGTQGNTRVSGSYTPSGSVNLGLTDFGSQPNKYRPAGTVSKPNVTVTPTNTNVYQIDSVGTLPTWSASVGGASGEELSFTWTTGSTPSRSTVSVMTDVSAELASTPTFTGTAKIFHPSFTGDFGSPVFTGTFTPSGTVSQPSFSRSTTTSKIAFDFGSDT